MGPVLRETRHDSLDRMQVGKPVSLFIFCESVADRGQGGSGLRGPVAAKHPCNVMEAFREQLPPGPFRKDKNHGAPGPQAIVALPFPDGLPPPGSL